MVTESAGVKATPATPAPAASAPAVKTKKLSYKDQRELEALPARIEKLEARQKELSAKLADPSVYQTGGSVAADIGRELQTVEEELLSCLAAGKSWNRRVPSGTQSIPRDCSMHCDRDNR